MIYNYNSDLVQHLFAPEKYIGKETYEKPKVNAAIQALSNYYEWQIETSVFNYKDLVNVYMDKNKDDIGVQIVDTKPIRGRNFRLLANAEKPDRKKPVEKSKLGDASKVNALSPNWMQV